MSDFDPRLLGPIYQDIYDALVERLHDGPATSAELYEKTTTRGAKRKTVSNMLGNLQDFGLIRRTGQKHASTYELTTLGRAYLEEHTTP